MEVQRKPATGSKWRSKIGKHDIVVRVVKVGKTTVALEKVEGTVNGSSKRGALMRLPLDAFYRRYERA